MIAILIAGGFEEAEALIPCDLLRRAGLDARLCGVTGKTVAGAHGIKVECDVELRNVGFSQIDAVILPGGMPGANNIDISIFIDRLLEYATENNLIVGAICAAPYILGRRGMLKGRRATCFPGYEKYMDGATLVDESVVRDGNYITAKAAGSAFDFALELINALKGKEVADEMRKTVFYEKY